MAVPPPIAEPFGAAESPVISWNVALQEIEQADVFWLATARPDGRPHVAPLLVIWLDARPYFCTGSTTRKARNLADQNHCVITVCSARLHLVVEGYAAIVRDAPTLERVADRFATRYGWQVTIQEGAFSAEGAPTAGPPPYDLYVVTPTVAFGFGIDETFSPTRWRFA
jgi:nitroimidazol reductase NimA-like FMN-containing flavoprotein (pyridoxamine 5'-phosphate oxidase superfamily)